MIYEFLYKTKPLSVAPPIILFIFAIIWSVTCGILCYMHLKHVPKNKEIRKYVIYKYILLSSLFNLAFLISSAIYVYDHVTTPSENTKTTDLYRITYTNSNEYVIVTDNQTYKISKASVKEK